MFHQQSPQPSKFATCGKRSVKVSQRMLEELGLEETGSIQDASTMLRDLKLVKGNLPRLAAESEELQALILENFPAPLTW